MLQSNVNELQIMVNAWNIKYTHNETQTLFYLPLTRQYPLPPPPSCFSITSTVQKMHNALIFNLNIVFDRGFCAVNYRQFWSIMLWRFCCGHFKANLMVVRMPIIKTCSFREIRHALKCLPYIAQMCLKICIIIVIHQYNKSVENILQVWVLIDLKLYIMRLIDT